MPAFIKRACGPFRVFILIVHTNQKYWQWVVTIQGVYSTRSIVPTTAATRRCIVHWHRWRWRSSHRRRTISRGWSTTHTKSHTLWLAWWSAGWTILWWSWRLIVPRWLTVIIVVSVRIHDDCCFYMPMNGFFQLRSASREGWQERNEWDCPVHLWHLLAVSFSRKPQGKRLGLGNFVPTRRPLTTLYNADVAKQQPPTRNSANWPLCFSCANFTRASVPARPF